VETEKIKVLRVDDHTLFRRDVVEVLAGHESLKVVGEAVDGLDAIEKTKKIIPDVVLMDLNMPRCNGLEAIQAIQTEMPQINILVLTISETEADLFDAMKFGAHGYLLKKAEPEELIHAIIHIALSGVIVSPLMATKLLGEYKDVLVGADNKAVADSDADLSPRESEMLQPAA
jgi:DNA-binding NarL/FixJ family response regulator